MVGMAIQNSICSPDFSGGVNMVSDLQVSSFPVTPFHCLGAFIHRTLSSNLSKLRAVGKEGLYLSQNSCVTSSSWNTELSLMTPLRF